MQPNVSQPPALSVDEQVLAQAFEMIAATRMRDVPLMNGALGVEVRGFRDWSGLRVGGLITPWCINIVILPRDSSEFRELQTGSSQVWAFPSGQYEFHGHVEPATGPYQQCSLFSPAFEFSSQADAQAAVDAALEELFSAPVGERTQAAAPAAVSRRSLFTGMAARP